VCLSGGEDFTPVVGWSGKVASSGAKIYVRPYSDSTMLVNLEKNTAFTITAIVKNKYGNTWYCVSFKSAYIDYKNVWVYSGNTTGLYCK
jgi:hypothetical protein